ncbi:nickel insertion protein [Methanooceanicella nereidis]|nr:nickel insertion protein [Methanocella sp. CWC-04]
MLVMAAVDDVSGEIVPYVIDRTMSAGANNVFVVNAFTKKNRMQYIVFVDVEEDRLEAVCDLLAIEFGTIGVRIFESRHRMLPYESETKVISVSDGKDVIEAKVRVKYLKKNDRVISLKAEYEDIKSLAMELSEKSKHIALSKLKSMIEAEAFGKVLESENIHISIDR